MSPIGESVLVCDDGSYGSEDARGGVGSEEAFVSYDAWGGWCSGLIQKLLRDGKKEKKRWLLGFEGTLWSFCGLWNTYFCGNCAFHGGSPGVDGLSGVLEEDFVACGRAKRLSSLRSSAFLWGPSSRAWVPHGAAPARPARRRGRPAPGSSGLCSAALPHPPPGALRNNSVQLEGVDFSSQRAQVYPAPSPMLSRLTIFCCAKNVSRGSAAFPAARGVAFLFWAGERGIEA
ncbi:MAG: hypothetical protein AAGJ35_00055 [Myxococcota bacterium]